MVSITNATGYTWTLPSDATIVSGANTNSITVNFGTASDNVTVRGTNSCGTGIVSPNYAVSVTPKPLTPVITANGYVLTSSAATGNQWYHDGTAIAGATSLTYNVPATAPGWYWTVVTLLGCSSDQSSQIYIQGVGIGENSIGNFNVYPVPNDGHFSASITWPVDASFNIIIYNELGVMIYQKKDIVVNKGTVIQSIDMRPSPSGVYTIVFTNSENKIIRKILVNK